MAAAAPTNEAEIKAVHSVIHDFVYHLLDGDAEGARALCIDGERYKVLIDAMAKEYAAQRKYCTHFTMKFGTEATTAISIKNAIDHHLEKCDVLFGRGVAHSQWGAYALRKIDGKWKIDFGEYDHDRALTEQLKRLQYRPKIYARGLTKILLSDIRDPFGEESRFASMMDAIEVEKFKGTIEHTNRICDGRVRLGVQGAWKVEFSPTSSAASNDPPAGKPFSAIVTVTGDAVRFESDNPRLKRDDDLMVMGLEMRSGTLGFEVAQECSFRYISVLGELRGSLQMQNGNQSESYEMIGARIK